jgi:hypothetical protein
VLVAAAVCPPAPLLVPDLGVGLGPDINALRDQCDAVVRRLAETEPGLLFIVGADGGVSATSFAPWGAAVPVDVPEPLPLPLLVGGYLTRGTSRSFVVVDPVTDPQDCAALGAELAATAERVALLVMGDGSARHDQKAPGYVDARAPGWDESVHTALATGDVDALLRLDPGLADELLSAGRPAWQVLAGAAAGMAIDRANASLFTPYGVGYHVALWEVAGRN